MPDDIQIPGKAVSEGTDLGAPIRRELEDLNLLGTKADTEKAGEFQSLFTGPPQSVALIEAGATAAAKWWAAGLGASAVATWGTVFKWWGEQDATIKLGVVIGASVVSAALVLAIGYLLASDVRGRAAASVATIDGRVRLAEAIVRAAAEESEPTTPAPESRYLALPTGLIAKNKLKGAAEEDGWRAIAVELRPDGDVEYLLVKGSEQAKVAVKDLVFV